MKDRANDPPSSLSARELARYARHFALPQVGIEGQEKLKAGSVLCIGAGGLGSSALMYLAAAGVGRIGIVDSDVVDSSNLQRQIVHGESDVGKAKTESAAATISEINPHVVIESHETKFTKSNAIEIARGYDLILDGTDNFSSRYLSNDVSYFLEKPNVYGSVLRFEGQCSVFAPSLGGPCYRCLFPHPPPIGAVPNCAEGGVLGVLPGVIGSLQALEAIKLLLGCENTLVGRLVHFDALSCSFRQFELRRDDNCPLCGESPTITELGDYDESCAVHDDGVTIGDTKPVFQTVSVHDFASRYEGMESYVLVDVREPYEVEICSISGAIEIPLGALEARYHELDPKLETFVICKSGHRSGLAVEFLNQVGFARAYNVGGGMDAWAQYIDPSLPRY